MIRCNRSLASWFAVVTLIALAAAATTSVAQDKPNDAVVPVPRDGNWMKRHESFNERVKKGNVDLLLIGDSITHGWESSGKPVWEKYYTPRNAVNLGIGGDRTQHVLWRLDNGNVEGISPKAAVLMIGTNNSGTNTPAQIAEGVEAVVKKLRTKLPKTKILVLAIFPRGADANDAKRKVNIEANRSIAKLADGEMVHFLDISDKFLNEDGTLSKEVMPDLLHLNEKSYTTWAQATEPKLKELMGEK